jgi:hypothetical protein
VLLESRGARAGVIIELIQRELPFTARDKIWLQATDQEKSMLDIVMLALGFGLFVAALGYTYACERL